MNFFRKITSKSLHSKDLFYSQLTQLINFSPNKINYYKKAFTHRSLNLMDDKGKPINYERLEFLGDAMLSAVIAAYLYKKVPKGDEGYLTKMRAKVVSRDHLNEIGKDLGLIQFVKSNVTEKHTGDNIHGNIFEALIGAIYLDKGYDYCLKFIYRKVIDTYVDIDKLEGKITSYKGVIIEWCQKEKHNYSFETYEDSGNQPIKHFSVKLYINGKVAAKGRATSKKKAEEKAAKRVFYTFQKEISAI